MTDVFLSFRFTGENHDILNYRLTRLKQIFEKFGLNVFCSFFLEDYFQENNFTTDEIYQFCEDQVLSSDIVFFFFTSHNHSNGMKKELRQALISEKKIIMGAIDNSFLNQFLFMEKCDIPTIVGNGFDSFCVELEKYLVRNGKNM